MSESVFHFITVVLVSSNCCDPFTCSDHIFKRLTLR